MTPIASRAFSGVFLRWDETDCLVGILAAAPSSAIGSSCRGGGRHAPTLTPYLEVLTRAARPRVWAQPAWSGHDTG
jgi:hypothetical protein